LLLFLLADRAGALGQRD